MLLFFWGIFLTLSEEKNPKKQRHPFFYENKRPKKSNGLLYFIGG